MNLAHTSWWCPIPRPNKIWYACHRAAVLSRRTKHRTVFRTRVVQTFARTEKDKEICLRIILRAYAGTAVPTQFVTRFVDPAVCSDGSNCRSRHVAHRADFAQERPGSNVARGSASYHGHETISRATWYAGQRSAWDTKAEVTQFGTQVIIRP